MKKLLLVYNPKSGRGVINTHIAEIVNTLDDAGFLVTVYKTKAPGDGDAVVAAIGAEYDRVVVAGGDGTLNGIVNGIMQIPKENRPEVGFIPVGSTNDTRNSFNLPTSVSHAAKIAATGTPFATDIGLLNDKYFTYVASLGELSAVSCFTSQASKAVFGHAAYITEGIKALLNLQSHDVRVTYDGGVVEGNYFLGMVTNAFSVGGFQGITGGNVDLQDGLFEVLLLKKPADLAEFNKEVEAVLLAGKGTSLEGEQADGLVFRFKSANLKFESDDDVQWVVDGENAGQHKIVEIKNISRAVNIISGKA